MIEPSVCERLFFLRENGLRVSNKTFIDLGLEPITLAEGFVDETQQIAMKYAHLCIREMIPCISTWTENQRPGVVYPEKTRAA